MLRLQTTKLFPTLLGRCLPGSRCFKAGQILLICSAEGLPSVSCTMPAAKWMCNASRIVKVFLSGDAGHSTRNHSMKSSRTGAQKVWNHGKPGLRYMGILASCPSSSHGLELQAAAIRRVSEFVPQGKDKPVHPTWETAQVLHRTRQTS